MGDSFVSYRCTSFLRSYAFVLLCTLRLKLGQLSSIVGLYALNFMTFSCWILAKPVHSFLPVKCSESAIENWLTKYFPWELILEANIQNEFNWTDLYKLFNFGWNVCLYIFITFQSPKLNTFTKHFLAKALQRDDSLYQSRFQGIDDDDLTMKSIEQLTAGPQECSENDDTLQFMKTKLNHLRFVISEFLTHLRANKTKWAWKTKILLILMRYLTNFYSVELV